MIKQIQEHNESAQPNDRILATLHRDFPQCFTSEGKFDLEKFAALAQGRVDISREGYELNFLGKSYANLIANTETETVIVPDIDNNGKPENKDSRNIYISGDNLDALKHLLKSYAGNIKCIYIDPPYNTGSDGFVYNDRFDFTVEQLQIKLGVDEEKAGRILDLTKRGSASHSAWLMFMAPRLTLARDLLSEDGVIFISIDDNEQANLKLLCDEVFGEQCFLGDFIWKKRQNVDSRTKNGVSSDHDYLLCYGRHETSRIQGKESDKTKYANPDNDSRGDWMSDNLVGLATAEQRPNLHYDLQDPATGIVYPCPETGWRYEPKRMAELVKNGEVIFPGDASRRPRRKKFLKDVASEYTGFSTILSSVFSTQGTRELRELFDGVEVFDFPKPVDYIKLILEQGLPDNAVVVDFFSGSATTAHAVMKLNAEDKEEGGKRSFILVQLQERCPAKSAAATAGYATIDQIGQERIRRAARKIRETYPDRADALDLGFKHYTLRDVPQNTLDKLQHFDPTLALVDENVLDTFGRETVLATWLMRDGYGFETEATELRLAGCTACFCASHLYFISGKNFDEDAMIALMDKYNQEPDFNPQNIVVFGYSFSFVQLEMLRKNMRALIDGAKNLKINLDIRY